VTETGLIVAQVVFLLLLYLFVWSVVRSGGKQVEQGPPPRIPVDEPVAAPPPAARPAPRPEPQMAMAAPPAPVAAPVPDDLATVGAGPAEDDFEDAGGSPSESGALRRARVRAEGMGFDMAANLNPRLVVERSPTLEVGTEIDLRGGMTIGRSEASGIRISDSFISHMHARIMRRGAYYVVEDLGSTNGTYLNDRRIDRDAQLKMHDELRLGETVLRYEE
jgi:hypothetical protein